jgi:hypothetical protein
MTWMYLFMQRCHFKEVFIISCKVLSGGSLWYGGGGWLSIICTLPSIEYVNIFWSLFYNIVCNAILTTSEFRKRWVMNWKGWTKWGQRPDLAFCAVVLLQGQRKDIERSHLLALPVFWFKHFMTESQYSESLALVTVTQKYTNIPGIGHVFVVA